MKHFTYATSGTCSRKIDFDIDARGLLHNVSFAGGCAGNLGGISRLAEGQPACDFAAKLRGTLCGAKSTSCPDQLAKAIDQALLQE